MSFESDPFDPPTLSDWRAAVDRDLKGADFDRKLVTRTAEGLSIQPLYTAADVDGLPEPAAPGEAPYVRGATAAAGWQVRQEYTAADPETVRAELLDDLDRGAEGVSIRLDRAFRLGSPETANVGRDGVAIATAADLAAVLQGVDLRATHLSIDAGGNTLAGLAMLATVLTENDINPAEGSFTVSGDPLGALARDGALPGSLDHAWDEVAAAISRAAQIGTSIRPWVTSTQSYHDAGADAVLELGLGIASAVDGLRALAARGIDAAAAAPAMEFTCAIGRDLFTEVAKLRALRLLWTRVLELCGAADAAASVRIHATCSRRTTTRRDPWVNMLRGTSETFAAIVGGASSIATTPFDAALGDSTSLSRRVARNTQLVLRMESHLDAVADPAGGSWYVEKLTHEMAEAAWAVFQDIEKAGGMGAALVAGAVSERVAASADATEAGLRKRRVPVTGVSTFANPGETLPSASAADPEAVAARRGRSVAAFDGEVGAPPRPAPDANAVEHALDAARAGASVDALTAAVAVGEPARCPALEPVREAAAFEALMDAADAHAERTGAPPRIFLAAVGPVPKHKARAGWTTHYFHAGGIRVVDAGAFESAADAASAYADSGADAAVVVAHDELYETLLPELVPALRDAGARWVSVAGRPIADTQSAPDAWVYVGTDVHATLTAALDAMGVDR